MKRAVVIIILSILAFIPYMGFEFITTNLYHPFSMGIVTVLLLTLPLILLSTSGFRYGLISGASFSVTQLLYYIILKFEMVTPNLGTFLIASLFINPLTTGIASKNLENKKTAPIGIVVAIIIQILFRIFFF